MIIPYPSLPTIEQADITGKRLKPPSTYYTLARIPVDIDREVRNEEAGKPFERCHLGSGQAHIVLDLRKTAVAHPSVGRSWCFFETAEGVTKLQFQSPSKEFSFKQYTSNCGQQDYILADVYDQSKYTDEGMKKVTGARLGRYTLKFYNKDDLAAFLLFMHLDDGLDILREWYDIEGRFYRGPTAAPYAKNNPNAMQVSHINGITVKVAQPPIHPDEAERVFEEDLIEESQAL